MTMFLLTLLLVNVVVLALFGLSRNEDDERLRRDEESPRLGALAADSAFQPTAW